MTTLLFTLRISHSPAPGPRPDSVTCTLLLTSPPSTFALLHLPATHVRVGTNSLVGDLSTSTTLQLSLTECSCAQANYQPASTTVPPFARHAEVELREVLWRPRAGGARVHVKSEKFFLDFAVPPSAVSRALRLFSNHGTAVTPETTLGYGVCAAGPSQTPAIGALLLSMLINIYWTE